MSSRDIWAKSNKTFTLFGEAIAMAPSKTSKHEGPRVLLFDIGGVCVSTYRESCGLDGS